MAATRTATPATYVAILARNLAGGGETTVKNFDYTNSTVSNPYSLAYSSLVSSVNV